MHDIQVASQISTKGTIRVMKIEDSGALYAVLTTYGRDDDSGGSLELGRYEFPTSEWRQRINKLRGFVASPADIDHWLETTGCTFSVRGFLLHKMSQ
jgi:hypothetical protein